MLLNNIVIGVNSKLAGEQLMYTAMLPYLDAVIDDINTAMNSCFPAFSDFTEEAYPVSEPPVEGAHVYPNYDFFIDKYIRSVVLVGAAYKFYVVDEEGAMSAPILQKEYAQALFLMQRDYTMQIPSEFSVGGQGFFADGDTCEAEYYCDDIAETECSTTEIVIEVCEGPHIESQLIPVAGPPGEQGPRGEKGDPGRDGRDIEPFIFAQQVPSATWQVTHNLNRYPSVTVVDSGDSVVMGEITYLSLDVVRIQFSAAFSGRAFFN